MLLSWFIPGSGFLIRRQIARGLSVFLILNLTFLLGLALSGGVILPPLSPGSPGFSYVSILVFLGQIGNGMLALLCVIVQELQSHLGSSSSVVSVLVHFFSAAPEDALFELGSFYIIISGTMNYFVLCNFHDRYKGTM